MARGGTPIQRDLQLLARDLREMGAVDIRREMLRNLRASANPAIKDAKENARRTLPRGGGLNEYVASGTKWTVRTNVTAKAAGSIAVRIRGTKQGTAPDRGIATVGLSKMDRGMVRHPVYGDRKKWWTNRVQPGWFARAVEKARPEVLAGAERAVAVAVAKFYARGR